MPLSPPTLVWLPYHLSHIVTPSDLRYLSLGLSISTPLQISSVHMSSIKHLLRPESVCVPASCVHIDGLNVTWRFFERLHTHHNKWSTCHFHSWFVVGFLNTSTHTITNGQSATFPRGLWSYTISPIPHHLKFLCMLCTHMQLHVNKLATVLGAVLPWRIIVYKNIFWIKVSRKFSFTVKKRMHWLTSHCPAVTLEDGSTVTITSTRTSDGTVITTESLGADPS